MGKKTTAEFVETEEVLVMIRALGVDYAQGYRVGPPDDLERFWEVDAPAVTAAAKETGEPSSGRHAPTEPHPG